MSLNNDFESMIAKRMEGFHYLIEKSNLQFKQYQYDGVQWCLSNELRPSPPGNTRGGFVADEMGLGKTLTMIGTMFVHFLPRTLIVVPPVLIHQWYNEIYKVTGHKALMFYGSEKKNITQEVLMKSPIVLTTYNMILPDNCILKNITWSRVIFDEAHHLRNPNTKRYISSQQIKARIRWLVTGTPIQNKKKDFYTLCSAAGMKSSFFMNPSNLRIIQSCFVLRRTKIQVGINLPPITITTCVVDWKNCKEMTLSKDIHALLPNQTNVFNSKKSSITDLYGHAGILTALLRARQACIMPGLMSKNMEPSYKLGLISIGTLEALKCTSKLDAVVELMLSRKENGKGKIVFCHFQNEIDTIAQRLLKGGMTKVVTYDGRNSGGQNLRDLSEPADAIVIQIQTGCEGLNLQYHFSEIYFVSPNWNPFVEDQAIARCHRIGQLKPVDVFRFEMRGFEQETPIVSVSQSLVPRPITLEKYVNNIQNIKRDISSKILDNPE